MSEVRAHLVYVYAYMNNDYIIYLLSKFFYFTVFVIFVYKIINSDLVFANCCYSPVVFEMHGLTFGIHNLINLKQHNIVTLENIV